MKVTRQSARSYEERFVSRIKIDRRTGCWNWVGATLGPKGYGQVLRKDGKPGTAHRVAWELFRGPIPKDTWIVHTTPGHSKLCVNPAHLEQRPAHMRKLNEEQRAEIKKAYVPLAKRVTAATLAKKWRVSVGTIYAVRAGRTSGARTLPPVAVKEIRKLRTVPTAQQLAEKYGVTVNTILATSNAAA